MGMAALLAAVSATCGSVESTGRKSPKAVDGVSDVFVDEVGVDRDGSGGSLAGGRDDLRAGIRSVPATHTPGTLVRPVASAITPVLAEPLSDRERDVLRLLATDLSGPEIAGELVVSLNTVRTHTHRIYAKLGVNNRRLAIRRARELDLL
jgi:DNA-binding CsgD family transcriptional regulator